MFSLPVTRKFSKKKKEPPVFLYILWFCMWNDWLYLGETQEMLCPRVCVCVCWLLYCQRFDSLFFFFPVVLFGIISVLNYIHNSCFSNIFWVFHVRKFNVMSCAVHFCPSFIPHHHHNSCVSHPILSRQKEKAKNKKKERNFFHVLNVQHILLILISDVKFCPAFHYS